MIDSERKRSKKVYVVPEITSYEVDPEAYATGSGPQKAKMLDWCLLIGCCDTNILPILCCH